MASLPSLSLSSTNPLNPKLNSFSTTTTSTSQNTTFTKRHLILKTTSLCFISLASQHPLPYSLAEPSPPSKTAFSGIANTKSWFQFYGDGFAIRVPPQFEDIMEPEVHSLAGKSEVLSVVVRPSNQLKITFLEAKDITDFGSLKEAAKIFVPGMLFGGSTLYSARTIKIKEEEGFKTYYFYEFGKDEQHVALVAAVNSGKTIIAGATAPESKWDDDGVKLRSAAISLTLL
ncbi:hypothetical protein Patl1_22761 [Pistacia atlantica]|uniref:Uncharacterized protein n=1 Tax=Pistacia atlantica TaxID=434234 RepID=A0ACC0ZZM2_9ROSI|nr:hypothetical protein Patl1_22761 [Pistacia atlantica]